MKRFLFGLLLALIGLVFSAFGFSYAVANPGIYNGTGGLLGSFLCADLLFPFVLSLTVMLLGVAVCFHEAYRRK